MPRQKPQMVCAWCKRIVRRGPEPASQGICTACRVALLQRRPIRIYIPDARTAAG